MKLQLVASAVLAATVVSAPAMAAPYTFTNIVDSTGPVAGFSDGSLHLGNNGVVTFRAAMDNGDRAVFAGNGTTLTPIDSVTSNGFVNVRAIAGNPNGTAAAYIRDGLTADAGVRLWNGTSTSFVADDPTDPAVAMNNSGTIAFAAVGAVTGFQNSIWTTSGGTPHPIANVSSISDGNFLRAMSISANGNIVFNRSNGSGDQYFLNGTTGQITPLGTGVGVEKTARINEVGTIVFNGPDASNISTFYARSENGGPTTVVKASRPGFEIHQLEMNNVGDIAFVASNGPSTLLFAGVDENVVIGIGDPLFGSTLSSLFYFEGSLNDVGQIAFSYILADGRRGIARADVVPEPTILALVPMAGAMLLRRRRASACSIR